MSVEARLAALEQRLRAAEDGCVNEIAGGILVG